MRAHNATGVQDAAYEGAHLVETLADLGVPYDEAFAYAEGVRRGGALVVVESSEERAERGMAILQRLHPVNIHERTAQWQQEGWTGAEARCQDGGHHGAPRHPARRGGHAPRSVARRTRRSGFRWWKKTSP